MSETLDVLQRPLDFASLDDWRQSLVQSLITQFQGDMGHVSLKGYGLQNERLAVGYPDGVFEEYVSEWVSRDPTYPLMTKLALSSYTRRKRHQLAGPLWYARYRRSQVFNEFYTKYGLIDGAGVYLQAGEKVAHFHVEPAGTGSMMFAEAGERALAILEPAFRASASLLPSQQNGDDVWMLDALLATDDRPVAIFAASGSLLHASRGYQLLLKQLSAIDAQLLRDAVRAYVQRVMSQTSQQLRDIAQRTAALQRVTLRDGSSVAVSSIVCQRDALAMASIVVVRLRHLPRGSSSAAVPIDETALKQRFGFTQRQLEVALLIARGMRSADIARTLGVKACTAARHTETVLRKLNVRSRGGVASALFLAPEQPTSQ